jgi:hypothetical protein
MYSFALKCVVQSEALMVIELKKKKNSWLVAALVVEW